MRSFNEFLKERDEDLYSEFDISFNPKKLGLIAALGLGGLGLGMGMSPTKDAGNLPSAIPQVTAEMSPEEMVKKAHQMTDHEIVMLKRDNTFDHYLIQAKRILRK